MLSSLLRPRGVRAQRGRLERVLFEFALVYHVNNEVFKLPKPLYVISTILVIRVKMSKSLVNLYSISYGHLGTSVCFSNIRQMLVFVSRTGGGRLRPCDVEEKNKDLSKLEPLPNFLFLSEEECENLSNGLLCFFFPEFMNFMAWSMNLAIVVTGFSLML